MLRGQLMLVVTMQTLLASKLALHHVCRRGVMFHMDGISTTTSRLHALFCAAAAA